MQNSYWIRLLHSYTFQKNDIKKLFALKTETNLYFITLSILYNYAYKMLTKMHFCSMNLTEHNSYTLASYQKNYLGGSYPG